MSIRVQCPSAACRATCTADESVSGRQVRCPKCGKSFVATPTLDGRQGDTGRGGGTTVPDPFTTLPAEFGRYRVLRLLGRGGMGVVYLAHDSQLGRDVALKIPFFDAGGAPQRAERFVREARSAAALRHPNICTVFDAGQIDGRAFITMEYVEGTPIDAVIDPDEPMDPARAAAIARAVALALEHAHKKGVVHRDLKPANVMLAPNGEPVVMDFGLAKRVADADPNEARRGADADPGEAKLTRDGGVLGTPSYMSPEQVRGDMSAVGPATDVYALGAMLFEMLTGQPPYTGPTGAVLGQILTAPVPPLNEFRPDADARLDAICRRAMAKAPADRFPSMAAMAEALGAYSQEPAAEIDVELVTVVRPAAVEPVVAPHPPASPFADLATAPAVPPNRAARSEQQTVDWADPEPAVAAPVRARWKRPVVAGLALAVLVPLVVWGAAAVLRVETPDGTLVVEINDPEVEARIKNGTLVLAGPDGKTRYTLSPADRDKKLEPGPYRIRVEGADGLVVDTPEFALKKGDRVTVRVTLDPKAVAKKEPPKAANPSSAPGPPAPTLKGPPPAPASELEALRRENVPAAALAYAGGGDPERAPSSLVGVLGEADPIQTDAVPGLAYSPDGRWLASGSLDKTIFLRDAATLQTKRVLKGHTGGVTGVGFSKDGKTLVSAARDGTIRLWAVEKDEEPQVVATGFGEVEWLALAVSPDGRFVAAGSADRPIKQWKWGQWDKPSDLEAVKGRVTSLSFSPNGNTLASSWDGVVRTYQTVDGKASAAWPFDTSNRVIAFHKDGKRLVTTGEWIKTWDATTGKELGKSLNEATGCHLIALRPDGDVVYICFAGGEFAYTLDVNTLRRDGEFEKAGKGFKFFRAPHGIWTAVYHPAGQRLAFGTAAGGVFVWDFARGERQVPARGHSHFVATVAVGPDGKTVISGGDDNVARRWDVSRPGESRLLGAPEFNLRNLSVSPDGARYAGTDSAGGWGGSGVVWSAATGKHLFTVSPHYVHSLAFSPDGKSVAAHAGEGHDNVILWEARSGQLIHKFPKVGFCPDRPAFTRDGRHLAIGTVDTNCLMFGDVRCVTEVASWNDDLPVCAVAISPDGRLIATGNHGGGITLWDVAAKGKVLRRWDGHSGDVTRVQFTPDGKSVVSAAADGSIRVWDPNQTRADEVISLGPAKKPLTFDLDPSGRYLFAAGQTPLIFVLKLPERAESAPAAAASVVADPDRRAAEYVLSIGGVVRIDGGADDIRPGTALPDKPFRLTHVNLVQNPKVRNPELAAFSGCKHIVYLSLHETVVNDSSLAHFRECTNLEQIHLGGTQITDAGLAHFKGFTKVSYLMLNYTKVTDAGLTAFKGCKGLQEIHLFAVSGVTGEFLGTFEDCSKLVSFEVNYTKFRDDSLRYLKNCPELADLHLSGTPVTDKGMAHLKDCRNLKVIGLAETQVGDDGLSNFKDCKRLTQLFLHNTPMTDKGLAYFKNCDNVTHLSQRVSKVTKAGLDDFRKKFPKCEIDLQAGWE